METAPTRRKPRYALLALAATLGCQGCPPTGSEWVDPPPNVDTVWTKTRIQKAGPDSPAVQSMIPTIESLLPPGETTLDCEAYPCIVFVRIDRGIGDGPLSEVADPFFAGLKGPTPVGNGAGCRFVGSEMEALLCYAPLPIPRERVDPRELKERTGWGSDAELPSTKSATVRTPPRGCYTVFALPDPPDGCGPVEKSGVSRLDIDGGHYLRGCGPAVGDQPAWALISGGPGGEPYTSAVRCWSDCEVFLQVTPDGELRPGASYAWSADDSWPEGVGATGGAPCPVPHPGPEWRPQRGG